MAYFSPPLFFIFPRPSVLASFSPAFTHVYFTHIKTRSHFKFSLSFLCICHRWPHLLAFHDTTLLLACLPLRKLLCQLLFISLPFQHWYSFGLCLGALFLHYFTLPGQSNSSTSWFQLLSNANDPNIYFPSSPYSWTWVLYIPITYVTSLLGCLQSTWNSSCSKLN